jgi:hypothetical protein
MNEKKINVAGRDMPLDDSSTRVVYADVTIEENVVGGVVHLGLGPLPDGAGQTELKSLMTCGCG